MKISRIVFPVMVVGCVIIRPVWGEPAKVTEAVNKVEHGATPSAGTPATTGTLIHDGEYVRTEVKSRAELQLPTTAITRLGSNTIFNYSVESNTVDLEAGAILFCKPPHARELTIKTAAVTAGITGTTGFVSVQGGSKHSTFTLGIVEGHAVAYADNHPFPLGPGDIVQFTPGSKPFSFAYDLPRFVKSSPLVKGFNSTLPNQSQIDQALAEYADDVSRGFIVPPSKGINYSGQIPVLSTVAYGSAQNANQPKGQTSAPPPPPSSSRGSFPSH
jgi:FecR protein